MSFWSRLYLYSKLNDIHNELRIANGRAESGRVGGNSGGSGSGCSESALGLVGCLTFCAVAVAVISIPWGRAQPMDRIVGLIAVLPGFLISFGAAQSVMWKVAGPYWSEKTLPGAAPLIALLPQPVIALWLIVSGARWSSFVDMAISGAALGLVAGLLLRFRMLGPRDDSAGAP